MSISLNSIRRVKADKPPRILIYGPPGKGKTTLASEFPDAIFVQVEDGTPGEAELTTFGHLKTYAEVMDALYSLLNEDHPFKYVVVDSVTSMQRLVFAEACERGDEHGNTKKRIEDFGFGKGYNNATMIWQEFMDMVNDLRERGMGVILIGHSSISRFDDPEEVSYDRYDLALRTSEKMESDHRGVILRDMDAVLLLKDVVSIKTEEKGPAGKRAIGQGGQQVWIHAKSRPAYTAKNRYGIPEKSLYVMGHGYEMLSQYLPTVPGVPPAEDAVDDGADDNAGAEAEEAAA